MGSIRLNLQLEQTTTTIVSKPIMKGLFLICLLSLSWIALTLGESTDNCVCNKDKTCAMKLSSGFWYVCNGRSSYCQKCKDRDGKRCKSYRSGSTYGRSGCSCGPNRCFSRS